MIDRQTDITALDLSIMYSPAAWNAIFQRFCSAIQSHDSHSSHQAITRSVVAVSAELSQTYRKKGFSAKPAAERLRPLLTALTVQPQDQAFRIEIFSYAMASSFGSAEHVAYREVCLTWLDDAIANGDVDPLDGLAAKIALHMCGDSWEIAAPALLAYIDHEHQAVRAAAANQLGNLYIVDDPALPLDAMFAAIKQKEIERPGVAGPFWSPLYFDFDYLLSSGQTTLDPRAWMLDILARRVGDEPNFAHYNGIDFYAHELLGGQAGYIRQLIEYGKIAIAIEAATEYGERIEDLTPLLIELGDNEDPEVARQAMWHLAAYYHLLHPRATTLGVVEMVDANPEIDLFLNYGLGPPRSLYTAIIYPKSAADLLDDMAAWKWLDRLLPPAVRGEMAPNRFGVGGVVGPVTMGDKQVGYTFAYGALVIFSGIPAAKRWSTVRMIWQGQPGAWEVTASMLHDQPQPQQ